MSSISPILRFLLAEPMRGLPEKFPVVSYELSTGAKRPFTPVTGGMNSRQYAARGIGLIGMLTNEKLSLVQLLDTYLNLERCKNSVI
jgi:hypothetical protein